MRLGDELRHLEREDPDVRAAALRMDRMARRAQHPDDYVRAENLQVEPDNIDDFDDDDHPNAVHGAKPGMRHGG